MSLRIVTIQRAWSGLDREPQPVWVMLNAVGEYVIRVGSVRRGATCELAGWFTNKIALHDFADALDAAIEVFEVRPRRKAA